MALDDFAKRFMDEINREMQHRQSLVRHIDEQLAGALHDIVTLREKLNGPAQELRGMLDGVPIDDKTYMKSAIDESRTHVPEDSRDSMERKEYIMRVLIQHPKGLSLRSVLTEMRKLGYRTDAVSEPDNLLRKPINKLLEEGSVTRGDGRGIYTATEEGKRKYQ